MTPERARELLAVERQRIERALADAQDPTVEDELSNDDPADHGTELYERELVLGTELRAQIWTLAVKGTRQLPDRTMLLTSINAVDDAFTSRTIAIGTHIPSIVIIFLISIVLVGAMLIGTVLGLPDHRQWTERLLIAGLLSFIVFIILDVEYPRLGVPLLRRSDAMLVELRKSMD